MNFWTAGSQIIPKNNKPIALGVLFVLQGLCVGYYSIEVAVEYQWTGLSAHTVTEAAVTLVLLLSLAYTLREIRLAFGRFKQVESTLHLASGAFKEIVRTRFSEWKFTDAEVEVALLTLKGFSIAEAAELRKSATGTIRVQLSKIYAKSGTEDRAQFVSLFIDELIDEPISDFL